MKTSTLEPDTTRHVGSGDCRKCGHRKVGVVTFWRKRVECAHAESVDDGMGGVSDCPCRDVSHSAELVSRRFSD